MADLSIRHLKKSYPTPGEPLVILDDISLELNSGDSLSVIGPSGSGKSTFLHIVGTLDSPSAGQVEILGEDPFQFPERQLAHFRNRHIGFVFQEHHLLPQLTALENVLIPAVAEGRASEQAVERARQLLDQVGLSGRVSHRPAELSGGERQRVAVARALQQQPRLLLADEPTGSLDQTTTAQIADMLVQLHDVEDLIMICVTHNLELARRFQKSVRLEQGKFADVEAN